MALAVLYACCGMEERFLEHLPQGAHILDVRSGGDEFTKHIADRRPDINITGIDSSHARIHRARKRMRDYGDRVQFQLADATRLQFGDGSLDGVISYGSIKHWLSRDAGLAECIRVLKPGRPMLIVELDRTRTFGNAHTVASRYPSGHCIDLDDAHTIATGLDLIDKDVLRIPFSPLLIISGRRPPDM